MNTIDYVLAGYNKRMSEQPPYDSSTNGMLFTAGLFCRENNIQPIEAKTGRGYSIIINRDIVLRNCDKFEKIVITKRG